MSQRPEALVLLVLVGGASVDFSRVFNAKNNAQNAADSAALRYLIYYLKNNDEESAKLAGESLFYTNVGADPEDSRWDVTVENIQRTDESLIAEVTADFDMETTMLGLFGMRTVDISVKAAATIPYRSISAAVVPDVSASMYGAPLAALKQAANAFGSEMFNMVPEFQSRLQFGVVPYSGSVNISSVSSRASNLLQDWRYAAPVHETYDRPEYYENGSDCKSYAADNTETVRRFGSSAEIETQQNKWEEVEYTTVDSLGNVTKFTREECVNKGIIRTTPWTGCIRTEQTEFGSTTLLANQSRPPLPPTVSDDSRTPHCPPQSSRMRTAFGSVGDYASYINAMETGYATGHDVGLLWASRYFAPEWASFFGLGARAWLDDLSPKYMIFLSDGKGVKIRYTFGEYPSRNYTMIHENTEQICTMLKERGVTIFGIFYISGSWLPEDDVVEQCASEGKYYKA